MDTSRQCRPRPARGRRAALSLGGILLAAVLAAGCGHYGTSGSGSGSGSTTRPASPAGASPTIPCAQITSLRTALTNLTRTKADPAHLASIVSDLTTIRTQLASLAGQQGAFSGEARQLMTELTAVETAARRLLTHPTPANVSSLTATVDHLKVTAGPLVTQMQAACPSPGSS